jgi:hypothetical protein
MQIEGCCDTIDIDINSNAVYWFMVFNATFNNTSVMLSEYLKITKIREKYYGEIYNNM